MDEFALIRRYFTPPAAAGDDGVVLGVGDDAALLAPAPGHELVVTTDTLVAGRHFPDETPAEAIGWKALAVNLSDLAAMGARARWFTLALTLPDVDALWLERFSDGLQALARDSGVRLVGGDTTRGPLSITVTALGEVPAGRALRRSGARPGDRICVTGTLGDAAAALALRGATLPPDDALRERLDRPQPRLAAGVAVRDLAHAALDLSDGLIGDLSHILDASGVGATLNVDVLPVSPALAARVPDVATRRRWQLAGGDDYELCVCLPAERVETARAALGGLLLTEVGTIEAARGLRCRDAAGATIGIDFAAYQHFP